MSTAEISQRMSKLQQARSGGAPRAARPYLDMAMAMLHTNYGKRNRPNGKQRHYMKEWSRWVLDKLCRGTKWEPFPFSTWATAYPRLQAFAKMARKPFAFCPPIPKKNAVERSKKERRYKRMSQPTPPMVSVVDRTAAMSASLRVSTLTSAVAPATHCAMHQPATQVVADAAPLRSRHKPIDQLTEGDGDEFLIFGSCKAAFLRAVESMRDL